MKMLDTRKFKEVESDEVNARRVRAINIRNEFSAILRKMNNSQVPVGKRQKHIYRLQELVKTHIIHVRDLVTDELFTAGILSKDLVRRWQ